MSTEIQNQACDLVRLITVKHIDVVETTEQDLLSSILDYLRTAVRASYVSPEMTVLTLQLTLSTEPAAKVAMHRMLHTNVEFYVASSRLLHQKSFRTSLSVSALR
ncbi:hypothetical protein BST25_17625 [Mycobacterium heidelbergense]|uniref:Uncharacterized protein n=2 Tax=Mycobacterium heidelbergense TaxID=53376 RepID=A0A1X0DFJ1_MYCHE|nr:hypothetical protein BST25_17625 [Mycobacterium heidelbergense]